MHRPLLPRRYPPHLPGRGTVHLELPGGINTTELLEQAWSYQVAFMPGEGFFVESNGKGTNCMRLSFGNVSPENIRVGMERLGRLIADATQGAN